MDSKVLLGGITALSEVVKQLERPAFELEITTQWLRDMHRRAYPARPSVPMANIYPDLMNYIERMNKQGLESRLEQDKYTAELILQHERQVTDLLGQIKALEEIISEGRKHNNALRDSAIAAEDEIDRLNAKMKALHQSQVQEWQKRVAELEKEREWLKLELETARAKADDTDPDELTAAIQENATLKIENSDLELQVNRLTANLSALNVVLDDERLMVEDLQNKLAVAEKQNSQLQAIITKLEKAATPANPAAEAPAPAPKGVTEAQPEGEPKTLNMVEFSRALRQYIMQNGGTRSKALKTMGFKIPSAMNQALMTRTSGVMRSKHAHTFVKFLGPQILAKPPGGGPVASSPTAG